MNENFNAQNGNFQASPTCPRCGAEIRSGATFCGNCGQALRVPFQQVSQNMDVMGIFDYLLAMILFSLPIVGIIMMLYWGFSSSTGINRKNFARSYLVIYVIQVILMILLMTVLGSALAYLPEFMMY